MSRIKKKIMSIIAIGVIILLSLVFYYRQRSSIDQQLSEMINCIPIAKQYFEDTKGELDLLKNGNFSNVGMKCLYDREEGRYGVFFPEEQSRKLQNSSLALNDQLLKQYLTSEEILALTSLVEPEQTENRYLILDGGRINNISGLFTINNVDFRIDTEYRPATNEGYFYIEALDEDYYIQVAIFRGD